VVATEFNPLNRHQRSVTEWVEARPASIKLHFQQGLVQLV